jgi:CheY-like chemotaxis protein
MIHSARRVFIADDNQPDIDLVKMAFSEQGCEVPFDTAKNGEEVLRYLRALVADERAPRPSVLILDLNMPKVSGREVLAYVSTQPALRSIPVVILTTSDSPRDRLACMGMGAHSYIVKAHALDEFFASLKPVMELVRA